MKMAPVVPLSYLGSIANLRNLHLVNASSALWILPLLANSHIEDLLLVVEESDFLVHSERESLLSGVAREVMREETGEGVRRVEVWVGSEERKKEWDHAFRSYPDQSMEPSEVESRMKKIEIFMRT